MQGSAGFYEKRALNAIEEAQAMRDVRWVQVHMLEANTYAMLALASATDEDVLMRRA